MKLTDIEQVNHLVGELSDIKTLIGIAQRAEIDAYQVFVEAPGDGSLKMSQEGPSTSHARGVGVSDAFLGRLKQLAVEELHAKREQLVTDLKALGVEAEGS